MRQGNGIDILGLNDPRAASIGIIYVSPNDDRKSVLAAIITQEKFGRKQVAVVLPPQNKAFQRPGDFEDLKSMRNRLQTHVVFIAPSGPGPGDFARQRRFPVYPSLESYAQALREDQPFVEPPKKGWFGTGKQKPAETTLPNPPAPSAFPQQQQGDHDGTDHSTVPFIAGAAAGGAADSTLHADTFGSASPSAPVSPGAEDDYALSPDSSVPHIPPPAQNIPTPMSATHAPNGSGSTEPAIIDLVPRRGRITGKLPEAAPAGPVAPSPMPNRASRQQNSGKIAAAGAGAAIGAAGAMVAGRAATGGGAPPTIVRGPAGGRGPTGGSSGGRRRARLLALALLLLSLLFVCGGLAYAQPNLMKNIIPNLQPPVTVTITPASQVEQNTYGILAVTGTPNTAQHQVGARILTASPSQQKTVTATGQAHSPGVQATGTLTFSNGNFTSYTVGAGTVFTSAHGLQVVTNVPAVIPAAGGGAFGTVTIAAHAVAVGATIIPVGDVNIAPCCGSSAVSVSNTVPFTGGQDPKNYSFLQQSDIDSAANPLKNALIPQAQSSLKSQMRSGEQAAAAPQCTPTVNSNEPVGDTGVNVSSATVTVTVTCKQEVYDQQGVQTLVSRLLTTKANTDLGSGYALVGSIVTNTTVQGVDAKTGTVSLLVSGKGKWVYQFSDAQKQTLAKLIAGMNAAQAKATLANQPGVAAVSIPAGVTTLPTDPTQIAIAIQPVTGFSGAGGTSPSGTPTVTGATVTTGTPTPQSGKGSSSGGGGGS